MTTTARLDLIATYKKETNINLGLLNKHQPLAPKISNLIFDENALEKPTQYLFNHISYYLVSFIDSQIYVSLTWPLYDSNAERTYRKELSAFITDCAAKNILTPVMSSYLVNSSCFKVTVLLFQLSQLAIKRVLLSKISDSKKVVYDTITEKYKDEPTRTFIDYIECNCYEENVFNKLSKYLYKKQFKERVAELLRTGITNGERKLSTSNAEEYIQKLVDGFLTQHELDESSKCEILEIKDVNKHAAFFDDWLMEIDEKLHNIEVNWNTRVVDFMEKCQNMQQFTEAIIKRHTGQIDRSSYTLEYNAKTDKICTKDLQNLVNSEQKFILRNLQNDGRLSFPNLVRAFFISICYILKNNEIDDGIHNFNEHLDSGSRNYKEVLLALKLLVERLANAQMKLQPTPPVIINIQSISAQDYTEIAPLPNLSDLKINRDQFHAIFDTFTPFNSTKHQFNLRKRTGEGFAKPQPRSIFTPLYQAPKDDFLKSLISCRISSYDQNDDSNNMSIISNIKANETIAECTSSFTRQQITRLLSTKKSSSSKKFKYKQDRPNIKIKAGGLFNESILSYDSNGLFRSFSSPNLFDNRERRSFTNTRGRKLSIMQEDSPPQLEVSGIACLNSAYNSPIDRNSVESSRNNTSSMPILSNKFTDTLNNVINDAQVGFPYLEGPNIVISPIENISKIETPKMSTDLIKKTSSLEKIINRFKQVRANVMPAKQEDSDIGTIFEEKENIKNYDVFIANRNLLPDLLSPNCSLLSVKSSSNANDMDPNSFDSDVREIRRPRESLGAALGVDHTFLDQFDLID